MTKSTDNYREIGDVSLDVWRYEFQRTGSPFLPQVEPMHAAARPHSALALGQMWLENQYGNTGHIIKPEDNNPLSLRPWDADPRGLPIGAMGKITAPDKGQFLRFATAANCIKEWKRRLFDDAAYKGGVYVEVDSLEDMLNVYAPPGDIHPVTGVDNKDTGYLNAVLKKLSDYASVTILNNVMSLLDNDEQEEPLPKAKPYIVIVSGHRSTGDPGNPTERALTDDLARADVIAFRAAGFRADWFQRDLDGDSLPDMTQGDLTTVSIGARNAIAKAPEELVIMLDDHYNGPHSPVHVIVPDVTGLRTGFAGGAPAVDTAANNTLDVDLAEAIAANINKATGLTLYQGRLKRAGVMSERDTRVALDGGWRLGMFGATAPYRLKSVRLVVEHGGYNDVAQAPAFFNACAKAKVDAVVGVLGLDVGTVEPEPEPETPEPSVLDYPLGMDRAFAAELFGKITGADGVVYQFDETGPVSKEWLAHGRTQGYYPMLRSVRSADSSKYFVFENGLVIFTPDTRTEPVRVLADAA